MHLLQILRDPGLANKDKLVFLYKPTRFRNARNAFQSNSDAGNTDEYINSQSDSSVKKTLVALITKIVPIIDIENQKYKDEKSQMDDDIMMIDS